jgi:hypothetical protein
MNKYLQSNTVRLGAASILGAVAAYLSGQVDAGAAAALALTGVLQIVQRSIKLAQTPAEPGPPGPGAGA